jgi:hypothetical protein
MGRKKKRRNPTGRLTEAERGLGIKTVKRRTPDLELLGRIIVEVALADCAPSKSEPLDMAGLHPNNAR